MTDLKMKDQTLAKTGHENTGLENNRRKNNGQNFCENYGPENDGPKMTDQKWSRSAGAAHP